VAIEFTKSKAQDMAATCREQGYRTNILERCVRAGGARAWVFVVVRKGARANAAGTDQ
jgi:hypothetical protein